MGVEEKISLCMIVRNEEQYLAQCLQSVRPIVNEMVIVDTGSTDNTPAIAQRFGAGVHFFEWQDDFAMARNKAISLAADPWILVMDADEVISARDLPRIRFLVKQPKAHGFRFILRNYEKSARLANMVLNTGEYREEKGFPGYLPASLIRLFRKADDIYFSGRLHEVLDDAFLRCGKCVEETGIPIHHFGAGRDPENQLKKAELYRRLVEKKVVEYEASAKTVNEAAQICLQQGDYTAALRYSQRALNLDPNDIEAGFDLACSLEGLGDFSKAERMYAYVLGMDQKHAGAYNNLGNIFIRQARYAEAISILSTALEKTFQHPVILYNLARALYFARRYDEALTHLLKITGMTPDIRLPDLYSYIGSIFALFRDFASALKWFRLEVVHNPHSLQAHLKLGILYGLKGEHTQALSHFNAVLEVNPDHDEAKKHIKDIKKLKFSSLPTDTKIMRNTNEKIGGRR